MSVNPIRASEQHFQIFPVESENIVSTEVKTSEKSKNIFKIIAEFFCRLLRIQEKVQIEEVSSMRPPPKMTLRPRYPFREPTAEEIEANKNNKVFGDLYTRKSQFVLTSSSGWCLVFAYQLQEPEDLENYAQLIIVKNGEEKRLFVSDEQVLKEFPVDGQWLRSIIKDDARDFKGRVQHYLFTMAKYTPADLQRLVIVHENPVVFVDDQPSPLQERDVRVIEPEDSEYIVELAEVKDVTGPSLLEQIRQGMQLKHVDVQEQQEPQESLPSFDTNSPNRSSQTDDRKNSIIEPVETENISESDGVKKVSVPSLLEQIRQGRQLRHVDVQEQQQVQEQQAPTTEFLAFNTKLLDRAPHANDWKNSNDEISDDEWEDDENVSFTETSDRENTVPVSEKATDQRPLEKRSFTPVIDPNEGAFLAEAVMKRRAGLIDSVDDDGYWSD
ncbi:MAG: hypothetical protein H7A37_02645 [Chlamydiales bacterium]|nr:hypothetical protein [Chlamydiia bacterium]MCP5507187.1 hypothetical protein [Chlamydiales bacterium]